MEVRGISAEDTRALRRSVLRPDRPPEECVYPGDALPDTLHAGAFVGDALVGVATLSREAPPAQFAARVSRSGSAWRLRGMAVRPDQQGRGIGAALLEACLAHASAHGGTVLWCNARASAEPFYVSRGLQRWSGEFELPGIGAHFVMGAPVSPPARR